MYKSDLFLWPGFSSFHPENSLTQTLGIKLQTSGHIGIDSKMYPIVEINLDPNPNLGRNWSW